MSRRFALPFLLLAASSIVLAAQETPPPGHLDPTRDIRNPVLFSSFHKPLPEQYIWTHDIAHQDRQQRQTPRYFRVHFHLDAVPAAATLYVAGPRVVDVWVNGQPSGHFEADEFSRLKEHVFYTQIAGGSLHAGDNVLAIQAQDGYQLVAKILPAGPMQFAPALLITDSNWKATRQAADGWQTSGFDDRSWPAVDAQGTIEGNIDFFQWNNDAGLYDWPGYEGASPFLAHVYLPAVKVQDAYAGNGSFENAAALTSASPAQDPAQEFSVHLVPGQDTPGITLDFGREVTGRVQIISDSDAPARVSIAYGESWDELADEPYLGVNELYLPPHGTGVGPKSAFRYARIRFLSGASPLHFRAIRLEDIYYPVHYLGSFESSDPLLNRIWETGVYTSHLCMQDDIWDAPKRDRGRWMGDTDVSGRVIDAAFADHFLIQDTLTRLIGPLPITQPVNGIPGYSSFWFTELADYLRHSGQLQYVSAMHSHILALLHFMDEDFDAQNQFINHSQKWLYVDWSIGLNGDTPQSRETTVLEYIRAFRAGAWLLRQVGDAANADHYAQRADQLAALARSSDWSDGAYGPRWQTNAMAVISGVAQPGQYASIWQNVLSQVGQPTFRPNVITPYYGSYVLDAMAEMHHRAQALAWIREYWGGMIAEGATSFWEAYDPAWPKSDPHVDLQADDTAGYRISLAHGWSSGPAFWLMEQVLGIRPTAPGFAETTIRPDLLDLAWARGAEPTPRGLLRVDLSETRGEHSLQLAVDLPPGIRATVLYPVQAGANTVLVNGKAIQGTPAENGARIAIVLDHAGHYTLEAR
ncbi:MAG: alpha-L-rhamnosidase C-terminal domain-containing protein [Acidobacteriaceae bacterium]